VRLESLDRRRLDRRHRGPRRTAPRTDRGRCDTADHAYVADLRPTKTGPVTFRLADPSPGDNTGRVSVHLLRAGAGTATVRTAGAPARVPAPSPTTDPRTDGFTLLDESIEVPAAGTAPMLTTGVTTAGVAYDIEVRGTVEDGHGYADAQCSRRKKSSTWRRHASVDPYRPDEDNLGLYIDGRDLPGEPAGWDSDDGCDLGHAYHWRYVPAANTRVSFAFWDPQPADNTGVLRVRVRRLALPAEPAAGPLLTSGSALASETVFVRASDPVGTTTTAVLKQGVTYAVRVSGRYSYGAGLADAECATAPGDAGAAASWRRRASDYRGLQGKDLFDLYLDGRDLDLRSVDGHWDTCTADSVYVTYYKPKRTTRVRLAVWGLESRDASGGLTVQITKL
jgi:hypothetical protein